MNTDLETILNRLGDRPSRVSTGIRAPYLYLDPEGVKYLFLEIAGLGPPPAVRLRPTEAPGTGPLETTWERTQGLESPALLLFEAMAPVLKARILEVGKAEDLEGLDFKYAWIRGPLQATHFPDGNLNLEIGFAGVRGLLFYHPGYFDSMVRPLIKDDRIHALTTEVEALVFVHGPVRKIIFYHQSYGDNQEHDWLPLVPVSIRHLTPDREDG
ncbi:MAG: hypothetical protein AB1896_17905 [Thermodesulfobacteriota bacterium]